MNLCKHCLGDISRNAIGEQVCFCELTDKNENVSLGDCLGNCESQEPIKCCETCEYWQSTYQQCKHPDQRQCESGVYDSPPNKCCGLWESYV